MNLARQKHTSFEAARAGAAVLLNGKLANLWKESGLSRQHTAPAESAVTNLHKELEVAMFKVSNIEWENETLRNEFETLSKTHVETETGLAKELVETHDDLAKKTRECDTLKAKVGKFEKGLATLPEAPNENEN